MYTRLNHLVKSKYFAWLIVGVCMLTVIAISYFVLIHNSIRLDESQSLWQTSRSLSKMFEIIAQDVHIPLYHTLLHIWQAFLGNDVSHARIMSLIFFVATIPLIYKMANYAYRNRGVALFATILVTLSPFLNWYANEVRMYSLLTLLVVANQYFFLKIYRENDRYAYIGYAITACLGIYTHYFFAVYLVIQAVFFLFFRHKFKPETFKRILLIWIFVAVLFAPWIYFVISQGAASNTRPLLTTPTTVDLFNTFDEYIVGFQEDSVNTLVISLWPLLLVLIFLLLKRKFSGYNFETAFFSTIAFAPLLIVFFFSLFIRPFFVSRYLAYCIPSLYILISYLLTLYGRTIATFLRLVLICSMMAGFVFQIRSFNSPVVENYRAAVDYINANIKYQDVFIVSAPFTIYPVEYYYRGETPINTLPIWDRSAQGQIPAFVASELPNQVNGLIKSYYRVWLLLSYDQGYEKDIRLYFDTNFQKLESKTFSKDLTLQVYQVGYNY
jgi:uncharacterized membrane protein